MTSIRQAAASRPDRPAAAPLPLEGRVAVITGGASGIGLATARALLDRGASVMLLGRDEDRGLAAVRGLDRSGRRVAFVRTDIREADDVAAAFSALDRSFGRLDIVFNNAGVNAVGAIDQLSVEAWGDCIDTNLTGAFLVTRQAIPRLRNSAGGVIINNASNAGITARTEDPAYCASKAGLIMLTKCLALAHAQDRIRAIAICPGPVAGTLIMERLLDSMPDREVARQGLIEASPLAAAFGSMITSEEVASLVAYLVSDDARMITGAVVAIDGGKSAGHLPR